MTNQMVHYSISQNDYSSHNKNVKINLSKMMGLAFLCLSILGSFQSTKLVD